MIRTSEWRGGATTTAVFVAEDWSTWSGSAHLGQAWSSTLAYPRSTGPQVATPRDRRETARIAALVTFLIVVVLGTILVLKLETDPDPRAPTSTTTTSTTVVMPAPPAVPDGQPVVILLPAPATAADAASGASEDRGFAERVFTPGVVALAQLGVALLAALLAAAAVQRALLSRYAFKIGSFEVSELGEEDVEGLKGGRRQAAVATRAA